MKQANTIVTKSNRGSEGVHWRGGLLGNDHAIWQGPGCYSSWNLIGHLCLSSPLKLKLNKYNQLNKLKVGKTFNSFLLQNFENCQTLVKFNKGLKNLIISFLTLHSISPHVVNFAYI